MGVPFIFVLRKCTLIKPMVYVKIKTDFQQKTGSGGRDDLHDSEKEGKHMIKGFKMKLYPGQEAEYEKRHNELWPEMQDMIHEHGGKNYTIFLDQETLTLFGYIEIEDEELWARGADTAINRKWWDFMADIMETNPDNSPVSIDLKTVFHLD